MSVPEYPEFPDSEKEDTDPDTLLVEEVMPAVPIVSSGQLILRKCPVCDIQLVSGIVLYRHLHRQHPMDKLYICDDCTHSFNNLKELSSHCSRVHHPKKVSCTQCDYSMTRKAKMHQHIRQHTQGVPYTKCGCHFPTLPDILHHEHLHDQRDTFECSSCDAVYHTRDALRVHITGKHGNGYKCSLCEQCFDLPVQRIRHEHRCEQLYIFFSISPVLTILTLLCT